MIKHKKIFITGGAGYLGKNLIKKWYDKNQITVFSRDEAKHYVLKQKYPKVKFVVGDVRNYDLLKRASANHDIGIFAASLKQIAACDENYEEANKVIVEGAFNSKRCAMEHGYDAACFISSDKSRAATTIYGAMKYIAGESFIMGTTGKGCRFTTAVYGNILNSTGSIIPVIWQSINEDLQMTLYSSKMTRFLLTVEDAMNLIETSLDHYGVNVIPVCKSFLIKDLMEIYHEKFGLLYHCTDRPRINEKIHEIMASHEEIPRMRYIKDDNCYLMTQETSWGVVPPVQFPNNEYSSRDCVISKEELDKILKKHNYFKP
jgi:UDP-N-acetylglucosamine 4,6-dehydratase/5-epimerase